MAPLLIVEDDPDIREDLAEALRDEGYGVVTAANGHEGLELLSSMEGCCLVLLDLMMPVMDGWEFRVRQLRDTALAGVPVIVITGASDIDLRVAQLDPASIIKKPFALDAILSMVARYCVRSEGADGG